MQSHTAIMYDCVDLFCAGCAEKNQKKRKRNNSHTPILYENARIFSPRLMRREEIQNENPSMLSNVRQTLLLPRTKQQSRTKPQQGLALCDPPNASDVRIAAKMGFGVCECTDCLARMTVLARRTGRDPQMVNACDLA